MLWKIQRLRHTITAYPNEAGRYAKAQGQLLQVCGLILENPSFSHEQLYMATHVSESLLIYSFTHQVEKRIILCIPLHNLKPLHF